MKSLRKNSKEPQKSRKSQVNNGPDKSKEEEKYEEWVQAELSRWIVKGKNAKYADPKIITFLANIMKEGDDQLKNKKWYTIRKEDKATNINWAGRSAIKEYAKYLCEQPSTEVEGIEELNERPFKLGLDQSLNIDHILDYKRYHEGKEEPSIREVLKNPRKSPLPFTLFGSTGSWKKTKKKIQELKLESKYIPPQKLK